MYGDIHRLVLEPVLSWLCPPGHCPVWSAGFQPGPLCAVLDSGFQQPWPLQSHLWKELPKKLQQSTMLKLSSGRPCPTDCSVWPGESPGSSKLLVLWNLFTAVCHRSLEAYPLPSWFGSFPHMCCQLWHLTMMSIFSNHVWTPTRNLSIFIKRTEKSFSSFS